MNAPTAQKAASPKRWITTRIINRRRHYFDAKTGEKLEVIQRPGVESVARRAA